MAELEQKHLNIASFDANDNEASMLYPALRVTDDVNSLINYFYIVDFCETTYDTHFVCLIISCRLDRQTNQNYTF